MKLTVLALFIMIKALGPHSLDTETEVERDVRLTTLADTMVKSAEVATCTGDFRDHWKGEADCKPRFAGNFSAALMAQFTTGKFESYFAQHIHEDRCRVKRGECDGGFAKSVFQLQAFSPLNKRTWAEIGGSDRESTQKASWAAMRVLSRASNCGSPTRMFASYATSHCDGKLKGNALRVAFYTKSLKRYRAHWKRMKAEQAVK